MSTPPISGRKRRQSTLYEQVCDNIASGGKKPFIMKEDSVLKEMMASAIIKHGLPLTFFEQIANKDILDYLKPGVKPERKKGNYIMEACVKERTKLKHALGCIPGRLCLTCDIWVDPCTNDYLCLTANYVDSNSKLQSKFLKLVPLPFPWDASILLWVLYNLLFKWGIEKKVFSITFDGKRCGDVTLDMLRDCLKKKDGALLCNGDYLHVCCGARFMDYMGEEGFKVIDSSISKIRVGVHYVMDHEKNRTKFFAAASLTFQGEFEPLWSDSYLRWNSTYLMLERFVKYRYAFEHVMIDDEYTGWHLTAEEWSRVKKMCKLLKPLYDISNLFLGTEHPTANLYFINVVKIGLHLVEALEDEDLEMSNLARKLKSEFDVYWDACHEVLALAMVFDPRYKFSFVKFCYEKLDKASAENKYLCTRTCLDRIFKTYYDQVSESNSIEIKDIFMKDFEMSCRKEDYESGKTGLNLYLKERSVNCQKHMDVLSWWKENEPRFGQELSLMAMDVLSIPITSFPQDSVFGMGYRVKDRLKEGDWSSSSNSTEALMATRNWLYGYPVDPDYPSRDFGAPQVRKNQNKLYFLNNFSCNRSFCTDISDSELLTIYDIVI